MEELGLVKSASTPAPVLVVQFDEQRLGDYQRIARMLRSQGIGAEVYPEARAMKKQLKYANRKGFEIAVIAGEDEFIAGKWMVKDLRSSDQAEIAEADLVSHIDTLLWL